ncbi:MAG TPA: sigma-70 family RNA polymerase sigma factor [Rubricoccaceae bacterium]|nr:sigma-70 family RNA polymerase sigma factor [Rubricoccaceae bacterium]
MSLTDEELVAAYLERGDERAFGLLVARHQERLFGYLVGMVRDRSVAQDLFQETFLRAIQAMHARRGSYEQQGRWLAWLMRIARNAALDHLRARKKWLDVDPGSDDDDGPSFWDRLADRAPDAEALLQRAHLDEEVAAAIERLPPEQREVVLMRHQSELTFREIAEITGVSINTALGRMRYALINLRKVLEPEWFEGDTEIPEAAPAPPEAPFA